MTSPKVHNTKKRIGQIEATHRLTIATTFWYFVFIFFKHRCFQTTINTRIFRRFRNAWTSQATLLASKGRLPRWEQAGQEPGIVFWPPNTKNMFFRKTDMLLSEKKGTRTNKTQNLGKCKLGKWFLHI